MSHDYEQDLARCDERTQKVAVALASGAEIEAKYYAGEAEIAVRAADAHDRANGIHRIALSDATVERAAREYEDHWGIGHLDSWECACGEFEAKGSDGIAQSAVHRHIIRAVLAAAVKEEQA